MLRIVRRLALGLPDAPCIPGTQVVAWHLVELKTKKVMTALCHKDSALYVTCHDCDLPPDASQLTESSTVAEIESVLRLDSVDLTNIYPAYTAQFALYCKKPGKAKPDVFIKHIQIIDLVEKGMSKIQTSRPAETIAHEAGICEWLAQRPHPNITEYLGVQVRDKISFPYQDRLIDVPLPRNSVLGLTFKRYDCTLDDVVMRRQKLDVKACLQAVAAGLQHLHGMGIVHGDIKPRHVFVKRGGRNSDRDQFLIGDFSSAHNMGSVVMFEPGDGHWSKRKKIGVDVAQVEDDWYAFRKIMVWLVGETGGELEDYKGIGKAAPKA